MQSTLHSTTDFSVPSAFSTAPCCTPCNQAASPPPTFAEFVQHMNDEEREPSGTGTNSLAQGFFESAIKKIRYRIAAYIRLYCRQTDPSHIISLVFAFSFLLKCVHTSVYATLYFSTKHSICCCVFYHDVFFTASSTALTVAAGNERISGGIH